MTPQRIVVSSNTAWNIVNFRLGLLQALKTQGFEVHVIAPHDSYADEIEAAGFAFHHIHIDASGISPAGDLALIRRYRKLLGELKPAVYLGYTVKPNVYGSMAAHSLGIPVINNISGLGTAFIKQSWLTHVVSTLYKLALRRSSTVFFQNSDDRDMFVDRNLVRANSTNLLPGSGIDLDYFTPVAKQSDDGEFCFLLVARLLWDKGLAEFVEAARLVRRDYPSVRFQLLGEIGVQNRTAVPAETVAQWQADGIAEHLGATDDVRPYLAGADCVVLPSYREGLPRSLLEASAMARPVIATDVPGCRSIVRDGENGFLCQVRSAEDLADKMRAMIAMNDDERLQMAQTGRQIAEAEYGEGIVISKYLDAVARAVGR